MKELVGRHEKRITLLDGAEFIRKLNQIVENSQLTEQEMLSKTVDLMKHPVDRGSLSDMMTEAGGTLETLASTPEDYRAYLEIVSKVIPQTAAIHKWSSELKQLAGLSDKLDRLPSDVHRDLGLSTAQTAQQLLVTRPSMVYQTVEALADKAQYASELLSGQRRKIATTATALGLIGVGVASPAAAGEQADSFGGNNDRVNPLVLFEDQPAGLASRIPGEDEEFILVDVPNESNDQSSANENSAADRLSRHRSIESLFNPPSTTKAKDDSEITIEYEPLSRSFYGSEPSSADQVKDYDRPDDAPVQSLEAEEVNKEVGDAPIAEKPNNYKEVKAEVSDRSETLSKKEALKVVVTDFVKTKTKEIQSYGSSFKPMDPDLLVKLIYKHVDLGNDAVNPAFIAATLYEESKFDPKVESRVGAVGLCQFLPSTGKEFGMNTRSDLEDPDKCIEAAYRYHMKSYELFQGYSESNNWPDKYKTSEHTYHMLASGYNAGRYYDIYKSGELPNIDETNDYRKDIVGFTLDMEKSAKDLREKTNSREQEKKSEKLKSAGYSLQDGNLVYYNQHDPQWRELAYRHADSSSEKQNISSCGCGPVAFASILSTLESDGAVNPVEMAEFFMEQNAPISADNCGSAWIWQSNPGAFKKKFGLEITSIKQTEGTMREVIDNGGIIMNSQDPGIFTKGGHLIAISGYHEVISKSGEKETLFYVSDPNSTSKTESSGFTADMIIGDGVPNEGVGLNGAGAKDGHSKGMWAVYSGGEREPELNESKEKPVNAEKMTLPEKQAAILGVNQKWKDVVHPTGGEGRSNITSGQGYRAGGNYHRGVDYSLPAGKNFYAPFAGVAVTSLKNTDTPACNNLLKKLGMSNPRDREMMQKNVFIASQVEGKLVVTYMGHLSEFNVDDGQVVQAGDIVGKTGSSGCSTGPHAHVEMSEGDLKKIDKSNILKVVYEAIGRIKPGTQTADVVNMPDRLGGMSDDRAKDTKRVKVNLSKPESKEVATSKPKEVKEAKETAEPKRPREQKEFADTDLEGAVDNLEQQESERKKVSPLDLFRDQVEVSGDENDKAPGDDGRAELKPQRIFGSAKDYEEVPIVDLEAASSVEVSIDLRQPDSEESDRVQNIINDALREARIDRSIKNALAQVRADGRVDDLIADALVND